MAENTHYSFGFKSKKVPFMLNLSLEVLQYQSLGVIFCLWISCIGCISYWEWLYLVCEWSVSWSCKCIIYWEWSVLLPAEAATPEPDPAEEDFDGGFGEERPHRQLSQSTEETSRVCNSGSNGNVVVNCIRMRIVHQSA